MQVYSKSSVSTIFAQGTSSPDENQPSAANGVRASVLKTPPPPSRRVCRSPFVTPDHPLYVFGERAEPPPPPARTRPVAEKQLARTTLESIQEMSLPSGQSSPVSPFQRLELSQTFHNENSSARSYRQHDHRAYRQQDHRTQHQVLRKSTTFGIERIRKMSLESSLQNSQSIIEGNDLEGVDLARRLRRLKRRLFLESVEEQGPTQSTPKHSNVSSRRASNDCEMDTMEGMEVVLEDCSTGTALNDNDTNYLLFSSSSLSLEKDEDDVKVEAQKEALCKTVSGDSSITTEVTAPCSTCGCEDDEHCDNNDHDPYWVSLSSISETE